MFCIPHASFCPAYHGPKLLLTAELYLAYVCKQPFRRGIQSVHCCQYITSACRSVFLALHAACVEIDARRFGAALPFKELSRQYTPCAWALVPDAPEVLMIEDLTKDAR